MKKILIIGANGFLGSNILNLRKLRPNINDSYSFIASDIENSNIQSDIPFYHMDITDKEDTVKKIRLISPDIIILTAAVTDVDGCETNKDLADNINVNGTKNVVLGVKNLPTKLVYMSTDFVFDGTKKEGSYTEEETPNPLSYYAKTKLNAELAIINSGIDYLICRTAVLYGWNANKLNFITWILNKLESNEEISIVTSQINNPTYVLNLAEILLKLIEKDAKGIFNTTGSNPLNRYEMALKCAEIFNLNKNLIKPIDSFKQVAKRPLNAALSVEKLSKFLGSEINIFSLEDGLTHMKKNKE